LVPAEERFDCLVVSTPARPNKRLFPLCFGCNASASHFTPQKVFSADKTNGSVNPEYPE
jgi:hypothetical protein